MPSVDRIIALCLLSITLPCAAVPSALATPEEELSRSDATQLAVQILNSCGFDEGMCLHVSPRNDVLTVALAKQSKLVVQGCTQQRDRLRDRRETLVAAGVADRASIFCREANHLPYTDGLVNLLVVSDWNPQRTSLEEVLRVLSPGGRAFIKAKDTASTTLTAQLNKAGIRNVKKLPQANWVHFAKPIDAGLGKWTHIKGGADQSYVSEDTVVAPWKEIRWIGDPRWGALYMSYGAFVTDGGRIYYKENRRDPGGNQWYIVARDAYNGYEYWRVKSGSAVLKTRNHQDYTMTCDDSHIYLVEDKTLVSRDGKTGEKVMEYLPGFVPQGVTVSGDFLLASIRTKCVVLDKKTGSTVWDSATAGHPAASDKIAYLAHAGQLEAVDLANSKSLWKTKVEGLPEKPAFTLEVTVMHKAGVVYVRTAEKFKPIGQLAAFDAQSGKHLWTRQGKWSHGVLPAAGEVWCLDRDNKSKVDNMAALVLDPRTGQEKRKFQVSGSVMAKCWKARGTANYLMYSNGWYLDKQTGNSSGTPSTRSPCFLGQQPANGLTYFMPHHCDCKVTLRGFLALSKPGARKWFTEENQQGDYRLVSSGKKASALKENATDWPTYRKDVQRSCATSAKLPARLRKLWTSSIGTGQLTQATTAYGKIFVGDRTTNQVFSLDAATGEKVWSLVVDGRVEFPPTLYQGMCLVGTGGGSVYCLNAQNGEEIWRLRAAPVQKIIADRERFESAWPVVGGVMIHDDTAFFGAGRSRSQMGGLWLFAVEPASGKVKWRIQDGSSGDMFVSDGQNVFHTARGYTPETGKRLLGRQKKDGMLQTTSYLTKVSIADYMASVEPNLSYKKHIELSDGRVKGENIAFNDGVSLAAWRYTPGTPNWKEKNGKYFLYANGSSKWLMDDIQQQIVSVALAGEKAYCAGVPVSRNPNDNAELWVVSATDGKKLQTISLDSHPIYDGLSLSGNRVYLTTEDGRVVCFGK